MIFADFFQSMRDLLKLSSIEAGEVDIFFYSEGPEYWVNFEKLIQQLLKETTLKLAYLTSDREDPGLLVEHPYLKTFFIKRGHMLNWAFLNIKSRVMVLTTPDLDSFQLKRSVHDVYYCYLNHSLLSLHTGYRKDAFDAFDCIFCSGPHHIGEIRAIEKHKGLSPKKIVKHGYGRLDALKVSYDDYLRHNHANSDDSFTVLVAPGWGDNNMVDVCLHKIIKILVEANIRVIFRPHPETMKHKGHIISTIVNSFRDNQIFELNDTISTFEPFNRADILISDWSGVIFDFSIITKKPVICVDVALKVKNPEWKHINLEPFEVKFRNKFTEIISVEEIHRLPTLVKHQRKKIINESFCYNIGVSHEIGSIELKKLVDGRAVSNQT